MAIIDTGADYLHPDLSQSYWEFNSSEKYGFRFEDNTFNPTPYAMNSLLMKPYHGTCCAGIISASINNGEGISGIAGNWGDNSGIQVMHLNITNSAGEITSGHIANAISFARNYSTVKVINMSFNMEYSAAISSAIDDAVSENGILFIVSAGNYQRNIDRPTFPIDKTIQFPAYKTNVVAVGATIEDDTRKILGIEGASDNEPEWGSCYLPNTSYPAKTHVELVAPGIHIPTTDLIGVYGKDTGNYYASFNGTSAAAPHVAAIAALIFSLNPSLTQNEVKNILLNSANFNSEFMTSTEYGAGRVDAYAALQYSLSNYGWQNKMDLAVTDIPFTSDEEGAATIKMVLNYVNQSTSATLAQILAQRQNTTNTQTPQEAGPASGPMTAANIKNAIQYFTPSSGSFQNYTWGHYTNSDLNQVINPIVKWVSFNYINSGKPEYKEYLPALIPFDGSFNHWVAINGCFLPTNPWNGSNYTSPSTIYGFWISRLPEETNSNPAASTFLNTGSSTYKTQLQGSSSMGTGDFYYNYQAFLSHFLPIGGQYHGVVDPPSEQPISIVAGDPIKIDLSNKNNLINELNTKLISKLNKHKKLVEAFEKRQFCDEIVVENSSAKSSYTIIKIGNNNKTEVGIVVDNLTSELLEVNIPPAPVDYSLLTSAKVLDLLGQSKTLTKNDISKAIPKLVYLKDYCPNYYYPLWEVGVNNKKYYVSHDERLIDVKSNYENSDTEQSSGTAILQNYPNPFNPVTQIKFTLSKLDHVQLEVFDILGRRISTLVDEAKPAGIYSVPFNGANLPSGMYIYRLTVGSKSESRKMLLLK